MKFYIASNFETKDKVRGIFSLLKKRGHAITEDWTKHIGVKIDERDTNPEPCRHDAEVDIKGVQDADVFILLTEPDEGRAKYVELGAAMQSNLSSGKPQVFVVGEKTNQSIMYYHPVVNRRSSIEEVLNEIEQKNRE